jgi:hypothetical protein
MSGTSKLLREKLEKHKNGSRPGMTVNLTTKQAEELLDYVEDLEFMRGIAGDVLAHLRSRVPVPWFMGQAFADAIAFEHHNQSRKKREEKREGDTDQGVEGPEGVGASQPEAGE